MALRSAKDIEYEDQVISIRIQELTPGDLRPDEIDLIEESLCADSIGDIPSVGDFLGLSVSRQVAGTEEFEKRPQMFKVLTRYFSLPSMISGYPMHCNLVVEPVTDDAVKGRIIKD